MTNDIPKELRPLVAHNKQLATYIAGLQRDNTRLQGESELYRDLSYRDDHSKYCYNRRWLDKNLEPEFRKAVECGYPISGIMLDPDNLKTVVNSSGHSEASRSIKLLGDRLGYLNGLNCSPARYGGDEFFVLMPRYKLEETFEIAESIRTRARGRLGLNVSIGLASYPDMEDLKSGNDLLKRSDEEMFRAKNNGRDRIYPTWEEIQGIR